MFLGASVHRLANTSQEDQASEGILYAGGFVVGDSLQGIIRDSCHHYVQPQSFVSCDNPTNMAHPFPNFHNKRIVDIHCQTQTFYLLYQFWVS